MDAKEYKLGIRRFCVYPASRTGNLSELMYLALGLSGEAGEVANKIKKLYRDGHSIEKKQQIGKELGDVAWYFFRLLDELNIDFESTLESNYMKLLDREKRDVLQGNGDNR